MSEYNLEFAKAMAESSGLILKSESMINEGHRAALYTALVACEIALKYALAEAGVSVPKTHDLSTLIDLLSNCTVEEEISVGVIKRVSASRVRSVSASADYNNATLGNLLAADEFGASKFPNEIRYGEILKHFPAPIMQQASLQLIAWVKRHVSSIQA